MTVRLDIIAQGASSANRAVRFADDEGLENAVQTELPHIRARLRRYDRVLSSPARAARETAVGLGFHAEVDDALRDCDYGRWRGLALMDVAAAEPDAFAAWLSDPAMAPPGGESISALVARTDAWLDETLSRRGVVLAITHIAVVRAAVVSALGAGASAFWRIDVAPLAMARFSGHAGRWNLVTLGPAGTPP